MFSKEEYINKFQWNCSTQHGSKGLVIGNQNPNYITAFFEAFPNNPSCFIRGEGENIEKAEEECWNKYQQILSCNHEMERRNRTDGYAYCKHCSYSAMLFEPLTKCCKCKIPTNYSTDFRNKWYCKKHNRCKPKDKNKTKSEGFFSLFEKKSRLPRKYKKLLKKAVDYRFTIDNYFGRIKMKYPSGGILKFRRYIKHDEFVSISFLFKKQRTKLINEYKTHVQHAKNHS